MTKNEVGFHYGAMHDPLEKQANNQGYTLGSEAERLEGILKHAIVLHITGMTTRTEHDKILRRLHKKVIEYLKVKG